MRLKMDGIANSSLKKQQADEQYLARRRMQALPAEIERLEKRRAGLAEDRATAEGHVNDPLTIGTRACPHEKAMGLLTQRLEALPKVVAETKQVELGTCRGLTFGVELSPQRVPEVCVRGALTYRHGLSREHQGPRAVLYAVDRLIDSYAEQESRTGKDLTLAGDQLRDYGARQETGFAHEQYLGEMTELRNQLEGALSCVDASGETAELVERITKLKAAQTIEAAPIRATSRTGATLAEPVTTRIHREAEAQPDKPEVPDMQDKPMKPAVPVEVKQPILSEAETCREMATAKPSVQVQTAQASLFQDVPHQPRRPKSPRRARYVREKPQASGQLDLFS